MNYFETQEFLNAVNLKISIGSQQDLANFLQYLQDSIPDMVRHINFKKNIYRCSVHLAIYTLFFFNFY